jgi:hypothetical protein
MLCLCSSGGKMKRLTREDLGTMTASEVLQAARDLFTENERLRMALDRAMRLLDRAWQAEGRELERATRGTGEMGQ